jgi:serine/threonine-protein kinase
MGAVYKAHHLRLNRTVAVKIMSPGLLGETHRARFLREARAAAVLDHPNIMVVHDVGEYEDCPYIIMQYIDGKSVGELLDVKGKFDQVSAIRMILGAAKALEAAQEHRIVHRDIKPDNIMITHSGQVKVMDFGLAKRTDSEDMGVTASGVILGTPVYMSPEQFNAGVVDIRSDIYSLGVTFYHMVAGRPPFSGRTPYELRDKHMRESHQSPRQYSPGLSPRVCKIIDLMLAKKKEDRYRSASDLVTDLEAALAEITQKPFAHVAHEPKRGILTYVAIAVVAVIAAAAAAFFLLPSTSPEPVVSALEKEAAEEYKKLGPKIETEKTLGEYAKVLDILNSFPAKFATTTTWAAVESQRVEMMQFVISHLEESLGSLNDKIVDGNFAGALQESRDLAGEARELKLCMEVMPKTGKVAEFAAMVNKHTAGAVNINREVEEFVQFREQFEGLLEEAKHTEGQNLLDSVSFQHPGLQAALEKFTGRLKVVQSQKKTETKRERWKAAKQEILLYLEASEFEKAENVIITGGFEQSSVVEIFTEAKHLRNEIVENWKKYIETRLDDAEAKIANWELKDAKEVLAGYRTNESYKQRVDRLMLTVDERLRYLGDETAAEGFINAGSGKKAREILRPWLASPDKGIAERAAVLDAKAARVLYPGMVYIPAGDYIVGGAGNVKLQPYYIDKYEVTNGQYAEYLSATGHAAPPDWNAEAEPDLPVTGITCVEAANYAKWAGKRLPRQEEWEVAASWDSDLKKPLTYPWGEDFDWSKCNLGTAGTARKGFFRGDISPCGVRDMAGNVCEWTATRDGSSHVICGGSWADSLPEAARCCARFSLSQGTRSTRVGFRCAKDAEQ